MKRSLGVWWNRRFVGELTQDKHAELGFAYASDWLEDGEALPLSGLLPKREAPFVSKECSVFFGGLLPEGSERDAAARVLGVSSANDFSLLARLGGDVAGAIQFLPWGETPSMCILDQGTILLDDPGLIEVLDTLSVCPLLAGVKGLRYSLAGAQPKVPVALIHDEVALPMSGQPTTHVLKPPIPRYPGTTENEAFVMRLAAAVGLDVAPVEPRVVRGRKFLLIERYDRAVGDDGKVRRIHQEDFCQALGLMPEEKYEEYRGPTFKMCFELLRRVSARPEADAWSLFDAGAFNAIAGNADAHGKNFSILYGAEGPRLAPLYDLLSTVAYPELSPEFAMKIGRRARFRELDSKGWASFAADAGLDPHAAKERIGKLAESMASHVDEAKRGLELPGLDQEAIERFAGIVRSRAERCASAVHELPDMEFGEAMDVQGRVPRKPAASCGPGRER